ncbi:MAG: hypothetical protein JWP61_1643 [Friedmanniella sp.]|nr:hypothetical protein [Friedmanniella sp.]
MTTHTSQTVTREINAPAGQIFDLLTNPDRHAEFDGSGFVRSADKAQRIQGVGDTFRMNMVGDHMGGEYQTDNHISGFQPGKLIAWKTAPAGTEPPGWEWMYELTSEGSGATQVSLTYDWSKVTDKDLLKKISFPLVSADAMDASLASLASAVNG